MSVTVTSPPAGVNFTALPTVFTRIWFRRKGSVTTCGWARLSTSMVRSMPTASAFSSNMSCTSITASGRLTMSSLKDILPLSMRLTSRMSFTRLSKWSLDNMILRRQSRTRSVSFR